MNLGPHEGVGFSCLGFATGAPNCEMDMEEMLLLRSSVGLYVIRMSWNRGIWTPALFG